MKFDFETCRPLIPSTDRRKSNDDQYTSKGSIINEKQHEVLIQALVSDQNFEIQYLLENHFGLQDIYTKEQGMDIQDGSLEIYILH